VDKGASENERRHRVFKRIYAEVKAVDIPSGIFLRVIKSIVDNNVGGNIAQPGGEKII
jgi:hypothetical protein